MSSRTAPVLTVESRCSLGESPVWLPSADVLCWLDIDDSHPRLHEWNVATRGSRTWNLPDLASGMVATRSGQLLIVSQAGLGLFCRESGTLLNVKRPPFPMESIRFNDCGVDSAGRLWTGTMINNFAADASSADPNAGVICRIDPDFSCHIMDCGIGCPNTFAWSADGSTLYSADSATGCMHAYQFDVATGAARTRRVFANPPELGVPDGSAVDAEGYLWNARWGAGCIARFTPGGDVAELIRIPATQVTSCAFGGPGLQTLFVTTARIGLSSAALAEQPLAGCLFSFDPGVCGLPREAF